MEHYIEYYITPSVARYVYAYIGWNELRQFQVSDRVWQHLVEMFCEDANFKEKFNFYWEGYVGLYSYKEQLLEFINMLVYRRTNIPTILWKNKDFMRFKARHYNIFLGIDVELKADPYIILMQLKWDIKIVKYLDQKWLEDREYIMKAIKQGAVKILRYTNKTINDDKEIILCAIEKDFTALGFASDRIKSDPKVARFAINKGGGSALAFIHPMLLSDSNFMVSIIHQTDPYYLFTFGGLNLRSNRKFMIKAIQRNTDSISYLDNKLKSDPNYMLKLVKYDKSLLKYVDLNIKADPLWMKKANKCENQWVLSSS